MYKIAFFIVLNLFISISLFAGETIFRKDNSLLKKAHPLQPKSHIKVFLPSIPYSYIAKSTNSGLIRSYDNEQGWIYDLAKSHKRVDDFTYIFKIRKI